MEIKIVMHSELENQLKPNLELMKVACQKLIEEQKIENKDKFTEFLNCVKVAEQYLNKETAFAKSAKISEIPEERKHFLEQKKRYASLADVALENALRALVEAGGMDEYHYNYDMHFNRVVAGLMGSTCYMKDTFDELQRKSVRNILAIAKVVEQNGHHSTFGHSHLTLEITGIPKALAMVLNNEKEYCTSEKSARYTIMKEIEATQLELYDKWKKIFVDEISKKYGQNRPFFDAKGTKIEKLAQENARYMISVFTPTNMVYTTSFRQLNYLAHWFENEIARERSNSFYSGIKKEMQEFVDFVKVSGLYSEFLEDHKDRKLSLFGKGILKDYLSSSVYSIGYATSLACLAQEHRHRTINYHIDEYLFENSNPVFFIPPILKEPKLLNMWNEDIAKVSESIPQGRLVPVIETGETSDFLLKAMERECAQAQWEIMDITKRFSNKFSNALEKELEEGKNKVYTQFLEDGLLSPDEIEGAMLDTNETLKGVKDMKEKFDKLSNGARCTAGYKCPSPCGFKEGITLEREI